MIASFRNPGTVDVFNGVSSRAARRICPEMIWAVARRKLAQLNAVAANRSRWLCLGEPIGSPAEAIAQGSTVFALTTSTESAFGGRVRTLPR